LHLNGIFLDFDRNEQIKSLKELETQMEDMKKRYNTALLMIGEREEQIEELKADLMDVKLLYKSQINELLERIEKQERLK
jgi:hypothetical protein